MSEKRMQRMWIAAALLAAMLWVSACRATPEPVVTEPMTVPATSMAALTLAAASTDTPALSTVPDPAVGQQLWQQKPCLGCHGASAEGNVGPKLAGTQLSLDQVLLRVREGKGVMPAFSEDQVSDLEVQQIYAWLLSLAPPTPTSVAPTEASPTPTSTAAQSEASTATPTSAEPTRPPATPSPTPTPLPTSTEAPSLPTTPDPAIGRQVWQQKPCSGCHGDGAEGGIGPKLAGTGLSLEQVLLRVRTGKSPMPAFSQDQISDLEVQHIFAWLRSLAPPTPTPVSAPTFSTGALRAMWQHVNDMKVKSDFAKDLPERQAADDAGRLGILKQYAAEAVQEGQAAIAQANQALIDIPSGDVQTTIRSVIDEVNAVIAEANAAQGQSSFSGAWPHAAEMVRISRVDAWPLATQAVRDAGLVGNVRVRVTDPAGNPIAGAFVTVLTAHTPVGVRADGAGRVTISRVAAVPALQVKAYAAGLVYHEVHANLSAGTTADVSIALPGPSVEGQTPSVANAVIEPSSGPGNATVTFRVTATDPQGALNLAEDQIFALNPAQGVAYVLRHVGGDQYALQVTLANLAAGVHTWYFFAVDHQCNTSGILTVQYTAR